MAITKSQQARQMLKTAGAVKQDGVLNYIKNSESVTVPKEFKARKNAPATKLAYITAEEAKMLKKMKKGTPHKGPKGIPSYDSFDAQGGFTSGAAMSAAETGSRNQRDRAEVRASNIGAPRGAGPGVRSKAEQDLRSSFIAAGAGQRVNPGFFDSRNVVSPAELARAKAFAPRAFAKSRRGGILDFITGGGITGALIRGLGQRLGFGKKFNEPTYDMSRFSGLPLGGSAVFENLDIRDKFNRTPDDEEDDTIPITIDDDMSLVPDRGLLEVPEINLTPFQKDIKQDDFEKGLPQDVLNNLMAKVTQDDINKSKSRTFKAMDFDTYKMLNPDSQITPFEFDQLKEGNITEPGTYTAADGGMIGGGIMDAAGRQGYFFGKLVKKAKRAVKKIVKSPLGKLGIGAALAFSPLGRTAAGKFMGLSNPMKYLIGGGALSALPLIFGKEEEQGEGLSKSGSVGGQIDPKAYTDPYSVLFPAFRAEGSPKEGEKGIMKMASNDANERLLEQLYEQFLEEGFSPEIAAEKAREAFYDRDFAGAKGGDVEPVAKRTMPLLDMGGQEMDLRAEGGFVPIGRMEKADDVPARLSKNEFVFTAEAVRNAGDGDVDKGAEVMYNMMKNLESGGDVSKESQGLEGARNMFQTSKRLEEVI